MRIAGNQVVTVASKADLETVMRDYVTDMVGRLGLSDFTDPSGEWEIDVMFDATRKARF